MYYVSICREPINNTLGKVVTYHERLSPFWERHIAVQSRNHHEARENLKNLHLHFHKTYSH